MNRFFPSLIVMLCIACAPPLNACLDLVKKDGVVCATNDRAAYDAGELVSVTMFEERSFQEFGLFDFVNLSKVMTCKEKDIYCHDDVDLYPFVYVEGIDESDLIWYICPAKGDPEIYGGVPVDHIVRFPGRDSTPWTTDKCLATR
jgi:hypothetical protein